jgi:hypothetical protein
VTQVSDLQMEALRALLEGDDRYEQLTRVDLAGGNLTGHGDLGLAAITIAARQRFPAGWSPGDVISYVAALRARLRRAGVELDPRTTETQIQQGLRREDLPLPAGSPVTFAEDLLLVLTDLVSDVRVAPVGLDASLAEARMRPDAPKPAAGSG